MTSFTFKQFTIHQEKTAMKAGTDGVLLGAWCDFSASDCVLDVGTGTGLIALMAAQKSSENTKIDAIEIDADAFGQACENVWNSKFRNKINVLHQDFISYSASATQKKYDCIVSNPPFFSEDTGSPDPKRVLARQAKSLPFDILIKGVAKLLTDNGTFSVIIPWGEKLDFVQLCALNGLHLCKKTAVVSREGRSPIRVLLSFSKKIEPLEQNILSILHNNGKYTMSYKHMTADFYVNF